MSEGNRPYPKSAQFSKEIKFSMEPSVHVDATVDLDGKCIVSVHDYAGRIDDQHFFPHEADKLGRALMSAAKAARLKLQLARISARGARVRTERAQAGKGTRG